MSILNLLVAVVYFKCAILLSSHTIYRAYNLSQQLRPAIRWPRISIRDDIARYPRECLNLA